MSDIRVLSTGVFDLFHIGHLRYLQYARQQGMHLSVAVTPDKLCALRKGKWPVIPEAQRLEIIRGLGWVDEAHYMPGSLEDTDSAADWIVQWNIDKVVVGGEWEGSPRWQRLTQALADKGISVCFAPHTSGVSSSLIKARLVADQPGGIT